MSRVAPELVSAACELVAGDGRAILGVAGAPGAGKSTLVELLLAAIAQARGAEWVAHLPMDGFHLADAQLERLGRGDAKGAPDTFDVAGYAQALGRVSTREPDVYVPGFERTLEQPIAAALVITAAAHLVITEGNYLLLDDAGWVAARRHLSEVWFVDGDADLRRDRLVQRHIHFGKSPEQAREWVERSDEANARLVLATRARADRIIVNDNDFRMS